MIETDRWLSRLAKLAVILLALYGAGMALSWEWQFRRDVILAINNLSQSVQTQQTAIQNLSKDTGSSGAGGKK